jgi:L-lactate dehydrogenase complex protein LldF
MSINTKSRSALGDDHLRGLLQEVTARLMEKRAAAIAEVPEWERLRDQARAIKRATLASLDRYLLEFESQVTAHGGVVHWAADAAEACRVVEKIAAANHVRRVVKGKSMVSEEIGLNAFLEQAGLKAVETDFGEYILQIAGERPSHIIAPAIHKSRFDVGRLFAQKLKIAYTDNPETLAAHGRVVLRGEFCAAQMGISGVNFGVASTGTIVIVENEGNARLSTTLPPVHVALMGIEKLVPAIDDLAVFLTLLPRNATGQAMTSYVSFITGPRRGGDRFGPEQLHVVLIDNGRTRMLADPIMRDVLMCIRCGACQNACPIYRQIGGHSYGGVYAGPIGSLLGPGLEPRTSPPDLPFVSTLCGACADVCAVAIDIPSALLHLRQRAMAGESEKKLPHRRLQRFALRAWAEAMAGAGRYRVASRVMRMTLRAFARGGRVRRLPRPFHGWTEVRDFPVPPGRTFRQQLKRGRDERRQ